MTQITLQPVQSSNILRVGHHQETETLIVQFKQGIIYHYPDVTEEIFRELLAAESVGKYFHKNIRTKKFDKEPKGWDYSTI